ncbi:MAG: transposase [Verrucomicrobiota bacterium]
MPQYSNHNPLPAYDIHYSWIGWPTQNTFFPEVAPPDLFVNLAAAFRADELELESRKWNPKSIHLSFRAPPTLAPVWITQRAKGRLDHALRQAGTNTSFSRKVGLRAFGHNQTKRVEAYVRDQLKHIDLADPRYRKTLASAAINNPTADLSVPVSSSHGRYWYNLHLVFVVAERYRIGNPAFLQQLRERINTLCSDLECVLKRAAVMPDHLHIALKGNPKLSPSQIAVELQNATAQVARCRLWDEKFYAGTFGEYDCGAIDGSKGGIRQE